MSQARITVAGETVTVDYTLAPTSPWALLHDVDLADPTGWSLRNETQSNDNSRNLPANVTFGPEGMRIVGKREPGYNRPYTSGDALGRGYELPNYFRVEVTGRGPHERGLWPCVLWLRPGNNSDGEIDLMENFGAQPRVKATLHNEYGTTHKMIHGQLRWDTPEIAAAGPPDGLHTYVCEKTPGRILITIDGVTLMDVGPDDAPAGFDWVRIFETPSRTWYPRVTLQLGCGTANPTCATGQPADTFTQTDMLVTSLKMWTMR